MEAISRLHASVGLLNFYAFPTLRHPKIDSFSGTKMRSTIFIVLTFLSFSVLATGCINTITGDLGELVSESKVGNIEKQISPEYKLDPLVLTASPQIDDESDSKPDITKQENKDNSSESPEASELFTELPSMLGTSEPAIETTSNPLVPSEVERKFEKPKFAELPPQADSTSNQQAEASQPVVTLAHNPLQPIVPVNIAPYEAADADDHMIRMLPPIDPPEIFVSKQMTELVPPFAHHPELEAKEYGCCINALDTSPNDFPADSNPLSFVHELVDKSMDPDLVNFVSAPTKILPKKNTPPPPKPLKWDEQLDQTIVAIQKEVEMSSGDQRDTLESAMTVLQGLHSNLVESNNKSVPASVKQYWIHQINALKNIVDTKIDDENLIAITSSTLQELQLAATALRESAALRLSSPAICRKVIGFGQYETFDTRTFQSNQPVLIYCEIENFTPKIELGPHYDSYLTRISSSYEIADETGNVVQSMEFPMVTDEARKLRNDFFMHLPIRFSNLKSGDYKIQVEVHDFGSGKRAELDSPLRFSIR